jgi:hypothetical protein
LVPISGMFRHKGHGNRHDSDQTNYAPPKVSMIRIIEVGDIAVQGRTEPVFCKADDGNEYVVKGAFAGHKALIAEWVANRLGSMLGLPIPKFRQMRLDPMVMRYGVKRDAIERLGAGALFGSQRHPNLVEVRQADLPLINPMLCAKILAFDWWIANPDRVFVEGLGNPNLLWSESDRRLVVIDHNLAFDPVLASDFWREHAFRDARSLWSETFRKNMGSEFQRILADLKKIWTELPDDWTEVDCGLSIQEIEPFLWRFDRDADRFWSQS